MMQKISHHSFKNHTGDDPYSTVLSIGRGIGCCPLKEPAAKLFLKDSWVLNVTERPVCNHLFLQLGKARWSVQQNKDWHAVCVRGKPLRQWVTQVFGSLWKNPDVRVILWKLLTSSMAWRWGFLIMADCPNISPAMVPSKMVSSSCFPFIILLQ